MSRGFQVRIQAPMALFSRPELKSERYSYDIPTPSALRGVLESVYWHPGITYVIDEIKVINPIKRISVRRNELKSKMSPKTIREVAGHPEKRLFVNRKDDIAQRNSSILTDVDYIVCFHFEVDLNKVSPGDSEEKFAAILGRRLDKGQCYKQPYLGCREFAAAVERCEKDLQSYYESEEERDFGLMLYDLDYSDSSNPVPVFYHPIMHHGVIKINKNEVYR
ncbi:type I-C CRISPR-associated protein Cas5c [uncultured Faecalibaculum sp.]|uniref:type I-C CRISPR-associated protein Cas5c n=1 Tax=uncultured Faecalibaculum sp. TaxID=1729681 RepID=UPI00263073F5|nr:type I-C CRISPR-associated protein Cas5c [uncultured Faecalibaculum sp.]